MDARSIITLPPSFPPFLPPYSFSLQTFLPPLPPPRLLHLCTPATFPSLVALLPRPSPRDTVLALLQRPSAPLRCVHSQLHTTRRRPEMQGHAALRFSRVKPSLIPGATLHTIRERHGVASPLWPTLPLVQHVVTTDVTSRAPNRGCCGVTREP